MRNRLSLWLALMLACPCPLALANADEEASDSFGGSLVVDNQTPFTLKVLSCRMIVDAIGPRGHFQSDDRFVARNSTIPADSGSVIGFVQSRNNKIEGQLLCRILETRTPFYVHFRISRQGAVPTWIRVLDTDRTRRHPLVSALLLKNCAMAQPIPAQKDQTQEHDIMFGKACIFALAARDTTSCLFQHNCTQEPSPSVGQQHEEL